MKFLVQPLLSKILLEFPLKQHQLLKFSKLLIKVLGQSGRGILNIFTLFLRFMFLQPRMVRQISPNHFEEANEQKPWNGQFYA
jgi:hypothetical protein